MSTPQEQIQATSIPGFDDWQAQRQKNVQGIRPNLQWGAKRVNHRHQGVDYDGTINSDVGAAGDGDVVFAGPNGDMGSTVKIRHANGQTSVYGHLNKINVQTGATIKAGSSIGLLGQTGNAKGPHVHFEVHQNDLPIDPGATSLKPLIGASKQQPTILSFDEWQKTQSTSRSDVSAEATPAAEIPSFDEWVKTKSVAGIHGGITRASSQQLYPNTPASPGTTPQVTSTVKDDPIDVLKPTKPIEFQETGIVQPNSINPVENLANILNAKKTRQATGLPRLQSEHYKTPKSQDVGERVKIPFKVGDDPTPDEAVNGFLSVFGPDYVELGKRYKAETGRNILKLTASDFQREPDGSFYVRPSRGAVDYVNAYGQGGLDAADKESLRQHQEYTDAQNKAVEESRPDIKAAEAATQRGVDSPTVRGLTSGAARAAQTFGSVLPESVGGFENKASVMRAAAEEADKRAPLTSKMDQFKAGLGEAIPGAMMLAATAPLGAAQLPALGALEGSTPEERLRGGLEGAATQATFGLGPHLAPNITGTSQKLLTGATLAGIPTGEALARGESPVRALASSLPYVAMPFLHKGEKENPELPEIQSKETLGIQRAQTVPDFANEIASREASVKPTFLRDDQGNAVARVLNPEEVAQGAKPKIRAVHQADTQIRDDAGRFTEVPTEQAADTLPESVSQEAAQVASPSDRVASIQSKLDDMGAQGATLENTEPVRLANIQDTRTELAKAQALEKGEPNVASDSQVTPETSAQPGEGAVAAPDLVPERPETLEAQLDALEAGTRDAVLVTPGGQRPKLRPGLAVENTKEGVFYFDPKRTSREEIRASVADGSFGQKYLGHVADKPALGEPTAVVTAKDAQGNEVQSSAVPPEKMQEQVEATQAQNPKAQIETGGPELAQRVIEDRVALKPLSVGKESTASTERGTEVKTQYAIVEAKDLIVSHDEALNRNPNFPEELQPRERDRIASAYKHAGADPYELVDTLIVKGWELYDQKIKPTFQEWSRKMREEFGPEGDRHLRSVWKQLRGSESSTAAKNASMAEDQAKYGLPERRSTTVHRDVDLLERANLANLADPTAPRRIADKVLNDKHTLSDRETLQLDLRVQEVKNEHTALLKEIAEAKDAETIAAKGAEADALLREFGELKDAAETSGTEQGRAFRARRLTVNQDFDLLSLMGRAKKAKGRELTGEERTRYEDIVKERDKAIAERDSALEKLHTKRLQQDLDRATRQRKRTVTKEALDKEAVLIKQNIVAEFMRLKSQMSGVRSMGGLGSLDPDGVITKNLLKYARNRAQAEVGLKAEALIDEAHRLVSEFGVTRRQVAEALSGYGRQSVDKRSEAAKNLAAIRAEINSMLKAEDVAAGKRVLKQEGPKRDLVRNQKRFDQLVKQEAEWERKFNERDFELKPKAEPYPYNSDVRRAEDRVRIAEAKFNREMERERPGHQIRNISGVMKAWILSGPPTQAMNIVGTGSYQVFREIARLPAAIADVVWSQTGARAFGNTGQRSITGPSPSAMLDSVVQSAKVGGRQAIEIMRHGATKEDMARHQYQEIDFGVNTGKKSIDTGVKIIELAHNVIFRFMSASDRVFYQGAYKRNLIDRATVQAKNEGVSDVKARTKELVDNPPEQLDADAKHDALVSTFNNDNVLSSKIKRARSAVISKSSLMSRKSAERLNAVENLAMDFILPFDRTPTNVVARIVEASPLGYVKNAGQLIAAAMRKSMPVEHQRQMMQTFGNATAGTALLGLGWYLGDKDKKLITVEGNDVFLNIPGLPKINLRTASPVGNVLAVGARLREVHQDDKSTWGDYAKPILREPLNIPVLRAGSPLTETLRDPERSGPKTAARFASMVVPFGGAARWVGKGIDPAEKRYPDKSFTEQFKQNLPGLRESLPASRVRLLGSEVTKATKEAERLDLNIQGAKKQDDETPEQFAVREERENRFIKKTIEAVVAKPEYDAASDTDKVEWLKQAKEKAVEDAKNQEAEKPEKPEKREFPIPEVDYNEKPTPTPSFKRAFMERRPQGFKSRLTARA